ncbi:MAG: CooT family nickel-binding protein [Candidatus Bathyarchaeota archaeon]
MCEFKVILDGAQVAEDVVYARAEGGNVVLRDILGKSITLKDAKINEVNIITTRMILTRTQTKEA